MASKAMKVKVKPKQEFPFEELEKPLQGTDSGIYLNSEAGNTSANECERLSQSRQTTGQTQRSNGCPTRGPKEFCAPKKTKMFSKEEKCSKDKVLLYIMTALSCGTIIFIVLSITGVINTCNCASPGKSLMSSYQNSKCEV